MARRVHSGAAGSREAECIDVEASLRVDDHAPDLAVFHRNRRQRERPRLAQVVEVRAAGVVVEQLPRPLHAGYRERLRLHVVAAALDRPVPALLVGETVAATAAASAAISIARMIAAPRIRSSQRQPSFEHSPLASVSATLIARGIAGSPSTGQRSRHAPRSSR